MDVPDFKLTLFTDADLYTPQHLGTGDLLYCDSKIVKVGKVDQKALLHSGLDVEVIEAKGHRLVPGIIDPHCHLLGGSGENGGFSSQTLEITLSELIQGGTTAVVGTLGADTNMKTMAGLLAKVKGLNDEGISAHLYTGGYTVPPTSIMRGAREDIMFIEEVIGVGEVAISDERSHEPSPEQLSTVVVDAHMGGMLADKAGITHFHVGPGKRKLKCLWDLLEFAPDINPEWLYPTHINRSEKLITEAIALTKRNCFVDMDVTEGDLHKWLEIYKRCGGDLHHLTISSDAAITSPTNILRELRNCILECNYKLEDIWPLVSSNTAKVLKFKYRGHLKSGFETSLLLMDKKSLDLIHVISRGRFMVRDGKQIVHEKYLEKSNRKIQLKGALV